MPSSSICKHLATMNAQLAYMYEAAYEAKMFNDVQLCIAYEAKMSNDVQLAYEAKMSNDVQLAYESKEQRRETCRLHMSPK